MVGTYRVLTASVARRAGSFHGEIGFDLTRLRPLRDRMVELGRICVHPDHRSAIVLLALWDALAKPGPPARDPEFGTADLPLLTRIADIATRSQRRFPA